MTRGRKPTPTVLKLVRNNPGKRPINRREPKPVGKMPGCPDCLDAGAKREWRRLIKTDGKIGVWTAQELGLLAAYCAAYSTFYDAQKMLKKHGRVVRAATGTPMPSPWGPIANKAVDQMVKIGSELGLSPASRSRLQVPEANYAGSKSIEAQWAALD